MTEGTLYEVRGVARFFNRGGTVVRAVDGVDLDIGSGEFVALEGPSGSGKTTLLQLLGALDRATEGSVSFEDRDLGTLPDGALAELRLRTFGFVFQQFNLIPTLTALDNVEAGLAPTGMSDGDARRRAGELLAEVGLEDRAAHLPTEMSGGEQQRVAIARALAKGPRVILADEPTGNLDSKTGADIVALLSRLASARQSTVVVATHNAALAELAQRRLSMRDGRVVE